jgi:hypothetical protein
MQARSMMNLHDWALEMADETHCRGAITTA